MFDRLKDSKGFYIVLAIFCAILLWLYVDVVEGPDATKTVTAVPVTFVGEDTLTEQNLMILHNSETETVNLTLKGARSVLAKIDRTNIVASVRVSTQVTEAGPQSLEYTVTLPSFASTSGVTVTKRSVNTIDVNVVATLSKTVAVIGSFDGSVADGFVAGEFTFTPDEITISGETDVVSHVAYAVVHITGDDLSESVSGDYPFTLIGADGGEVAQDHLLLSEDTVGVKLPVTSMKTVPLSVSFAPGGGATEDDVSYTISPAEITVLGDSAALDQLDSINLGTVDLSQVVTTNTVEFDLHLDDGVTCASGETSATVTVTVSGLSTTSLEVSDIRLTNVPEGYKAELVTQSIPVMLRGNQTDLAMISESFVYAEVDLSGTDAASGSRTVQANIYVSGFSTVGPVGKYTAVVRLWR